MARAGLTERLRQVALEERSPIAPMLADGYAESVVAVLPSGTRAQDLLRSVVNRLGGLPLEGKDRVGTRIGSGFLRLTQTTIWINYEPVKPRPGRTRFEIDASAQEGFFRHRAAVMAVQRTRETLAKVLREL